MIVKVDNQNLYNAKELRYLFQLAYKVEAELLKAINFPPLKRTLDEFINSDNSFHCYYIEDEMTGAIEIDQEDTTTHIQSLVVHPRYFRQAIGSKLVKYVLDNYQSKVFTVETGLANQPAIKLYKGFDFHETKQWDTDHGVRKIRFEKLILT